MSDKISPGDPVSLIGTKLTGVVRFFTVVSGKVHARVVLADGSVRHCTKDKLKRI